MVYPTEIFLFIGGLYFVFCASLEWLANTAARRYAGRPAAA